MMKIISVLHGSTQWWFYEFSSGWLLRNLNFFKKKIKNKNKAKLEYIDIEKKKSLKFSFFKFLYFEIII